MSESLHTTPEQPTEALAPDQEDLKRRELAIRAIIDVQSESPTLANTPHFSQENGNGDTKVAGDLTIDDYREALDLLNRGNLPSNLKLKRNWSDNLLQHDEKESKHKDELSEALIRKIETLERERKIEERRVIDLARIKEHNKKVQAREKERSDRQAIKDEYIARQKLLHGEFKLKRNPSLLKSIEVDAENYVTAKLGSAENQDYGIYETSATKKASKDRLNDHEDKSGRKSTEFKYDNKEALETFKRARFMVDLARREYAQVIARVGSKTGGIKAVEFARLRYENELALLAKTEKALAVASGVSAEDIERYSEEFAVEFSLNQADKLVEDTYWQRAVRSGEAIFDAKTGSYRIKKPKSAIGKISRNFVKYWGAQNSDKNFSLASIKSMSKKSAIMAGLGLGVGIPAAVAGSILLGPILGGSLGAIAATKLSKGLMAHKLESKASSIARIDVYDSALSNAVDLGRKDVIHNILIGQVNRDVVDNRRRLVSSAAIAAAGGFAGQLFSHDVLRLGAGSSHHTSTEHYGHRLAHSHHPKIRNHKHTRGIRETLSFRGDNIENEVGHYLSGHGYVTNEQNITKVTQAILNDQHINWDQARHLPVGYKFHIPLEVLEQLAKDKK